MCVCVCVCVWCVCVCVCVCLAVVNIHNKMNFLCPSVQGVVGTSAGTVWYINWSEKSSVKLVSGHAREVSTITVRSTAENIT